MKLLIALPFFTIWLSGKAQDSTQAISGADSLLADLIDTTSQPLLPDHMVFTQRVFWALKGLLRLTGLAPLSKKTANMNLKFAGPCWLAIKLWGL